jgi:hypothetical protein
MNTHELHNLSPLIEASDYWVEDPARPLWLKSTNGRISLALTKPASLFADLVTVPDFSMSVPDIERPTVFVEWPSGRHRLNLPASWDEEAPYEGRPYVLGKYDCYTIVMDWMNRERGIEMTFLTDTPERLLNQMLTDGVFVTNEEVMRWERVIVPQPGDGILFALSSSTEDNTHRANHCGVYLGGGEFLHHLPNRASCIEEFDKKWRSRVVSYMRFKG